MGKIFKELSKNQTNLIFVPTVDYNKTIVDVIKSLKGKTICYVTLNKTFSSFKDIFKKNKIPMEDIVFIDGISKTIIQRPPQEEHCFYCSSPGALTELSLTIDKFLRHEFDYLIFDSLSSLIVYQDKAPVNKFIASLVTKIKKGNTNAIFYALASQKDETLIKESSMFIDKVITL